MTGTGDATYEAPKTDWNPLLRAEFAKPYWAELRTFVAEERSRIETSAGLWERMKNWFHGNF